MYRCHYLGVVRGWSWPGKMGAGCTHIDERRTSGECDRLDSALAATQPAFILAVGMDGTVACAGVGTVSMAIGARANVPGGASCGPYLQYPSVSESVRENRPDRQPHPTGGTSRSRRNGGPVNGSAGKPPRRVLFQRRV